MRRLALATALLATVLLGAGCTGVTVGVGGGYYPWGSWYARGPYYGYGRPVIVVPPDCGVDCIDPEVPEIPDGPEAVALPEPPPDMGMPDYGPMDMDMGGGFDMGGYY